MNIQQILAAAEKAQKNRDPLKFIKFIEQARAKGSVKLHNPPPQEPETLKSILRDLGFKKKVAAIPNFLGRTFIRGALDARGLGFSKVKAIAGPKQPIVKIPQTTISGTLKRSMER